MAAENSEPRSTLVFQLGVFSIVAIVVVRFGLSTFFSMSMDEEYARKVGEHRNEQLTALKEDAKKALSSGPMPIDRAMQMVASSSRQALGDSIAPRSSDDTAALVGWSQAPKAGLTFVAPTGSADPAGAAVDGGAVLSAGGDGGLPAAATADAAAPKPAASSVPNTTTPSPNTTATGPASSATPSPKP